MKSRGRCKEVCGMVGQGCGRGEVRCRWWCMGGRRDEIWEVRKVSGERGDIWG